MNDGPTPYDPENPPEEITPDYTRIGFRDLQRLCKARNLAGNGTVVELVERLRAYDAQHGTTVDLSPLEDSDPDFDPTADDADGTTPEPPVGAGEAASAPAPTGDLPPMLPNVTIPAGGTVTSAAPAVVVVSAPGQPSGPPQAADTRGRANLSARDGVVKVGEAHGAAAVHAFRAEYPHGWRDLTDNDHFTYIAETHAAAHAAGYATRGGVTVGERVGFGSDADGRRTVIYQVSLKRNR